MQVSLPDRPGSLGMLASAIGSAGADIRGLEVLKSEDGTGYDQITVAVPGTDPSKNTLLASSKLTPCFFMFEAALAASQSNLIFNINTV